MAGWSLPDMRPWGRGQLVIPPKSVNGWLQLAVWELWMGVLVSIGLGLGVVLVATSPDRIIAVSDLSACYGPAPVPLPCEHIIYRGGALNAIFTALCGAMLIVAAAWLLWELWSATEPKPIADDFLRLLHESFGRDWRNPFTWPWSRMLWAYGFTLVGGTLIAAAAALIWTTIAPRDQISAPKPRIDTSQSFRVGQ